MMRNDKGITLASLMIYVIGMVIVIGIISNLTTFFYKNIDMNEINKDTTTQFTKFSSVFSKEINNENNTVIDAKIDENGSYIIFSSGNQYTFKKENKSIYKNKIKICENIEECNFSYKYEDSQYKINIDLRTDKLNMIGDNSLTYVLK